MAMLLLDSSAYAKQKKLLPKWTAILQGFERVILQLKNIGGVFGFFGHNVNTIFYTFGKGRGYSGTYTAV